MSRLPPVVVITGGLGTRIKSLTGPLPKAMVNVDGTPFIDLQLRLLAAKGATEIILCVGHGSEAIANHVGDGRRFGLNVGYSLDGNTLLGTAGAVKKAASQLSDSFLVLYGDSYLDVDYAPIVQAFQQSGKPALMTVFRNEDRYIKSNILFADGQIKAYSKTGQVANMKHCDYGLSCYESSVFEKVTTFPCDLTQVTQELIEESQLAGFEVTQRFYEVGTPEGLSDLEHYLRT